MTTPTADAHRSHGGIVSGAPGPQRHIPSTLGGQTVSSAISDALDEASFAAALEHSDVIGQAKGILMQRLGIDADQAFTHLKRESQNTNTKLWQVAERVSRSD